MAYLLRALIALMLLGLVLTNLVALGLSFPVGHIQLALLTFLYTLFAQAFVMFYFIGVHRLLSNVSDVLAREPGALVAAQEAGPYLKKTAKLLRDAHLCKRQTIPWTMLILTLGALAFLLGGAHDTGLVARTTHSGVAYGFSAAALIGFFRQWRFLKVAHGILRKVKSLYRIPDAQM